MIVTFLNNYSKLFELSGRDLHVGGRCHLFYTQVNWLDAC